MSTLAFYGKYCCIEQWLRGEGVEQSQDLKVLQDSYVLYCKLCLLLHSVVSLLLSQIG